MLILTSVRELAVAYATNSVLTAFPTRVPTATAPTGDGFLNLIISANPEDVAPNESANNLNLLFYGVGTGKSTAMVTLWRLTRGKLWIPIKSLYLDVTLDGPAGVATYSPLNTENLAGTIAVTASTTNTIRNEILSVASGIGEVLLDTTGAFAATVDLVKGANTSINCLWRVL